MVKQSAGLLPFRRREGRLEVFLVHPGGPFWKNKDEGAWSIAKGEFDASENALAAARREFAEETGFTAEGAFIALKPVRQKSGKWIHAFAVEADFDTGRIISNTFALEWPPKSGRVMDVPEIDRAAWFGLAAARVKIIAAQRPLLGELAQLLARS